ncbi:MAG: pilin [Candidatus Altiarchaeota archaeon]
MEEKRRKACLKLFLISVALLYPSLCTNAATPTTSPGPAAYSSTMQDVELMLLQIGSALGVLMITISCIRWIAAQNPEERESAKKGVIYVMIGLLLLRGSENIISFLLRNI